jgi:hypothetical protein
MLPLTCYLHPVNANIPVESNNDIRIRSLNMNKCSGDISDESITIVEQASGRPLSIKMISKNQCTIKKQALDTVVSLNKNYEAQE